MKKNLLLIAAVAATAMGANAQSQYCFMNLEALGIEAVNVDKPAGTALVENEYGKYTLGFDQSVKKQGVAVSPYKYIALGSDELQQLTDGITGTDNPKGNTMTSLPASGMFYQLETTQTGYYTFVTKMNGNKNYWAYEGETACCYALGYKPADLDPIYYVLPHDQYDQLDLESTEMSKYFAGDAGAWTATKKPFVVAGLPEENGHDGVGFLQVVSVASVEYPSTFTVFATGSKMGNNGFIFTPAAEPSFATAPAVKIGGVESVDEAGVVTPAPEPIVFGGNAAGIENVVAAPVVDENAPVYNIYGQRVSKDTKGLLIQNGVKFYNR